MQREAGWQSFSSRGLYRIDKFQVFGLFERVAPRGVVFAPLTAVGHQFRVRSCIPCIRARHDGLNFHASQTAVFLDTSRGTSPV